MLHTYAKRVLPFLLFVAISGTAAAQNSNQDNDPYTRFGVGEWRNGLSAAIRGIGSASSAFSSATIVNSDNPASYADLKLTTYEAGFEGALHTLHSGGKSYTTGTNTLSYLSVGIPLSKHAGMTIGLRPQTHIYYKTQNDTAGSPNLGRTVSEFDGDGGLNYAYIGLAGKIKGFSLGANFGYMFGNISTASRIIGVDTTHVLSSDFLQYTKLGGLYWKGGAMYYTMLSKKMYLRLGGTVTIQQNLNAWRDEYRVGYYYDATATQIADTAYKTTDAKGKLTLPMSFSGGASIGSSNWAAYADYTASQWSNYRNFGEIDSVTNSMRISGGFEYIPNPQALHHYFQRVTYRIGFYYGTDMVYLQDTKLNYYAITLGASLPLKRNSSFEQGIGSINTAIEIGRRGTEANGLIRESFFRFSLGFSLSDRWFKKRVYE